jgi:hypothetical protein
MVVFRLVVQAPSAQVGFDHDPRSAPRATRSDGVRRQPAMPVNAHAVALHRDGATIKGIARGDGIARQTVRRRLHRARDDAFRVRASSPEAWTEHLGLGCNGGCRNATASGAHPESAPRSVVVPSAVVSEVNIWDIAPPNRMR